MLKKSMLGALTSLALLACQPITSEISQVAHLDTEVDSSSIPKPGNTLFPQADTKELATPETNGLETGLQLISSTTDELGFRHLNYQPIYEGVPLWGVQTIIHIDKEGKTYRVDGDVPEINSTLNTTPQLDTETASTKALSSLSGESWTARSTTLFVLPAHGTSSLVWQVECVDAVKRQLLLVDAHNGDIIKRVEGSYYGGTNPAKVGN